MKKRWVLGSNGNDVAYGETGNGVLDGGAGNDRLVGMGGNDVLMGGEGGGFLQGDLDGLLASQYTSNDRLDGGGHGRIGDHALQDVLWYGAANDPAWRTAA